jgi:FkbM family methyltransferase
MRYFPVLFLFFLTIPAVTKAISVRSLVKQSIGLLPEKMRFQTHSAVRACAIRILGHSFVGEIPKKQMRKWFASDSPIIIEAGGHLGSDTREFKQLWPESTVYTFEPVPDLYAELLKNTGGLSGVYPFPFALGPQAGIQKIHVSKGGFNGSSSLLRPKIHKTAFPEVTFPTQINVTVVNLEKWAEEHRVGGVDS